MAGRRQTRVTLQHFVAIKGAYGGSVKRKSESAVFLTGQKQIGAGHFEVPDPDFLTEATSDQKDNRI
jgi:hypothetical protein